MEIGTILHGFRLEKIESIPELDMEAYRFTHLKSGADLVWLSCDDENRAFSISFKTLPEDSTGVFHILEHSVLCGSKKFPLREPFVDLIKGSLSTFLNAMTFPDKTMYPVASTNEKDFLNLIDVYMDAVLHTRIDTKDEIFMQEGWHYEPADGTTPAKFTGVVYNEMKGSLSSPDSVFWDVMQNELYPDTVYAVNSGGDPRNIPELTYEAFLAAHRKYYSPENSYICLYGNICLGEILAFLNDKYLSAYDKQGIHFEITRQSPLGDRTVYHTYELGEDEPIEGNAMLGRAMTLCDYSDRKTILGMKLLLTSLTFSNAAPLKKAVLRAGLGDEFDACVNDYLYQPFVTFRLKKTDAAKADQFLSTIDETLRKLVLEGINRDLLIASINKLDFSLRERDNGSAPGVEYAISVMDTWLYGGDPTDALKNRDLLREIREDMEHGYFEALIEKYLLHNDHSLTVIFEPSHTMAAERLAHEAQAVHAYEERIGAEGIRAWQEKLERLRLFQTTEDTPEIRALLPHLERSDLDRRYRGVPVHAAGIDGVPHRFYDLPTSGIDYLRVYFDVSGVPLEDIPYLSLLTKMLFNVSTEKNDLLAYQNDVDKNLGGLDAYTTGYENENGEYHPLMVVFSKFLEENYAEAKRLLSEGLLMPKFLPDEVADQIKQQKASYESALAQSGDGYATTHAASYLSRSYLYDEYFDGVKFGDFLSDLCLNLDGKITNVCAKLDSLMRSLLKRERALVSFVGSKAAQEAYIAAPFDCYTDGPAAASCIADLPIPSNEGIAIPSSVAYDGMAMNLHDCGIPYNGSFRVLSKILTYDYLWNEVRVQGGAYGIRAIFTNLRVLDMLLLSSYRDPHVKRTYETFRNIVSYLRRFSPDESEMTKYVIGAVSMLDAPTRPAQSAYLADLRAFAGLSDERMQQYREETIDATAEQIRRYADVLAPAFEHAVICTVGAVDKVQAAKDLFDRVR